MTRMTRMTKIATSEASDSLNEGQKEASFLLFYFGQVCMVNSEEYGQGGTSIKCTFPFSASEIAS